MPRFTKGRFIVILAFSAIAAVPNAARSFPAADWAVGPNERVEVLRDFICFGEGKAGYRQASTTKIFSREVLSAEVMISGYNMWYTRKNNDHGVMKSNVDAWVTGIGLSDPDTPGSLDKRYITLKFQYAMVDKAPTGDDDYNDACIGYTVIARTR